MATKSNPVANGALDVAVPLSEVADRLLNTVLPPDEPAANKGSKQSKKSNPSDQIVIAPLRQGLLYIPIVGVTPLKILRFSQKSRDTMQKTQEAGTQAFSKKKRDPKDFKQGYEDAKYRCTQKLNGKKVEWLGLNASGVRNGCIETCRMTGYVMTKAKMSIFCVEDGFDDFDSTPLCRIEGNPEMTIDPVRNSSGVVDLRPRVMFKEWRMTLKIRFDLGQFSPSDIIHLLIRVGQQNGLGEGRPNGTNGAGTGNGIFELDMDNIRYQELSTRTPAWKPKKD